MDDFWKDLGGKIRAKLANEEVILSRDEGVFCKPKDVKIIPKDFQDEHNDPLFDDLERKLYISPNYTDEEALRRLGLQDLSYEEMLDRVKANCKRFQEVKSTDDWHERVSLLLSKPFGEESKLAFWKYSVRSLPIIPLETRRWTTATTKLMRFQISREAVIPDDIGLHLVPTTATNSKARRDLFKHLGVEEAKIEDVQSRIYKKHNRGDPIDSDRCRQHLWYLYDNFPADRSITHNFRLVIDNDVVVQLSEHPWYRIYADDGQLPYGPGQLFDQHDRIALQAQDVHFLRSDERDRRRLNNDDMTFVDWLENVIGVKRDVQLLHHRKEGELSEEILCVAEKHPDKLLGLLKKCWTKYEANLTDELVDAVSRLEVPMQEGGKSCLGHSYLPVPSLTRIVAGYDIKPSLFLKLPEEVETNEHWRDWEFLEKFDVGVRSDRRFFVLLLDGYLDLDDWSKDVVEDLYTQIADPHKSSSDVEFVR